MKDDRIDLSPLDPSTDVRGFEDRIRRIMGRAEPLLVDRRRRAGIIGEITRWRRPMLMAAAVVALVASATLALVHTPEAEAIDLSVARAIGVPTTLAMWVSSDALPSPAQLMTSAEVTP